MSTSEPYSATEVVKQQRQFRAAYGLDDSFVAEFQRWRDVTVSSSPSDNYDRPVTAALIKRFEDELDRERSSGGYRRPLGSVGERSSSAPSKRARRSVFPVPPRMTLLRRAIGVLADPQPTRDRDRHELENAINPIFGALDKAHSKLIKYETQELKTGRAVVFQPDPIAALLIVGSVLAQVLLPERDRLQPRRGRHHLVGLDHRIEALLSVDASRKEISDHLREVGYPEGQANEKSINARAARLRKAGFNQPPSPKAGRRRKG